MESVDDVDSTGAQLLGELVDELDRRGVTLTLARVRTEIRDELRLAEIETRLHAEGVHLEVDDAVAAHLARLDGRTAAGAADGSVTPERHRLADGP
jgi:SulP family sulfate permease